VRTKTPTLRSLLSSAFALPLLLVMAGPASAGRAIVTPRLEPPGTGALSCGVVNASSKKTIEGTVTILSSDGTPVAGPTDFAVAPLTSSALSTSASPARHCVVEVTKGGKRNARVSLYVRDSAGNVLAAVQGE